LVTKKYEKENGMEDIIAIVASIVFLVILSLLGIRFFKARRPIIGTTLIYIGISPLFLGLLSKFGIIKDTPSFFFSSLLIIIAYSLTIPYFLQPQKATK
jgi:hypothetical protein